MSCLPSGYGSQALALKYLGIPFEHWKLVEWAIKSIQAYKDIHFTDDDTDYTVAGKLGVAEEWIKEWLYKKGISSNYNEPMTQQQIDRLSKEQVKTIYNNIQATHNLVNIQQVKGKDLEIEDTDKYEYIMTYSFPCQDLSLAGKGKGMSDTSTRSGMLWEVERILTECENKPQILLMENVPQVHSEDNLPDFNKWKDRLEELGYKNYFQDLIASAYGIPQTRNRCFMVSILGDYSYTFPKPIPLKLKLKDMLEDNVDEKYYLSDKAISGLTNQMSKEHKPNLIDIQIEPNKPFSTLTCGYMKQGHYETYLKIKNANSKGYLEATDGDGIDISSRMEYHRGTVQKGKTQTLTTMGGENNGVVVKPQVLGGIGEKDSNNNTQWKQQNRVYDDNVSISITTAFNPYYKSDLRIRKLTPRECGRLMNVKDEDIDKILKNQSDSSAYHLFGDSICTNVLMAIFGQLLDIEWEKYLWKVQ